MLSGRLLLLRYRGRRSGRTFEIPLRYAGTKDGPLVAVAVHPERKLWWRSFAGGATAVATLRGKQIRVEGVLANGSDRDTALAVYAARFPRSAPLVRDAAVVVFDQAS